MLRLTSFGVEKKIGGVKFLVGIGRIVGNRYELHAQSAALAVVTGHDEKDAIRQVHLGADGHQRGRITAAEGILEGDDEALGVEETSNIVFGECAHQRVKG